MPKQRATHAEVIARTQRAVRQSRLAVAATARAVAESHEVVRRSREIAQKRAELLSQSVPSKPEEPVNDNADLERLVGPIKDLLKGS